MSSSSLNRETRKVLSRWAKKGYYVYLRPVSSRYVEPGKPHRVYWSVQVEFRTVPPGRWDAEGFNLDECIAEIDAKIGKPNTRPPCPHVCVGGRMCAHMAGHEGSHVPMPAGWLAPASVTRAEVEERKAEIMKRDEKPKERPRKRPKGKKSRARQ